MNAKIRRVTAVLLIVSMGGLGAPIQANASMISTDAATASPDRERIATAIDRTDVRAKLEAYGVNAADVKARVSALTDDEAALLAARIDELPAGGFLEIILFVFVLLLITDILGLTKIFPFTKPIR